MACKGKSKKVAAAKDSPQTTPNSARAAHDDIKPRVENAADAEYSSHRSADNDQNEKDDTNTADDSQTGSTPPVPSNFHRDISHIAKHLQNQSTSLFSAVNFAHYIKYSIGNAVQNIVARLTDVTDYFKNAMAYLRNLTGEKATEIIVKSVDEAKKWIV